MRPSSRRTKAPRPSGAPSLVSGQRPRACPNRVRTDRLEACKAAGLVTGRIPDAGLAPVRPGTDTTYVSSKKAKIASPSRSPAAASLKAALRERVERWHQRVALFSSFALHHIIFAAVVVEPGVRAGAAVKLAGEREEWDKGRADRSPSSMAWRDTWS